MEISQLIYFYDDYGLNDRYDLSHITDNLIMTQEARVVFGPSYTTLSLKLKTEMQKHTRIKTNPMDKDKTYYYFLTSFDVDNYNVYTYHYIIDTKYTFPEILAKSSVQRVSLKDPTKYFGVDLDYPTLPVEQTKPINPTVRYVACITSKDADPLAYPQSDKGISCNFKALVITPTSVSTTTITFTANYLVSGKLRFKCSYINSQSGQAVDIQFVQTNTFSNNYSAGSVTLTNASPTYSNPDFNLPKTQSTGFFEVENFPSVQTEIPLEVNTHLDANTVTYTIRNEAIAISYSGNSKTTFDTIDNYLPQHFSLNNLDYYKNGTSFDYEATERLEARALNQNVSKTPIGLDVQTLVNDITKDGRKLISIQLCTFIVDTLSDVKLGDNTYSSLVSYKGYDYYFDSKELFLDDKNNIAPQILNWFGYIIKLEQQKLIKLTNSTAPYRFHSDVLLSTDRITHVIYSNTTGNIQYDLVDVVDLTYTVTFDVTSMQEYTLNNSQSQAIFEQQNQYTKQQMELTIKQQNESFYQSTIQAFLSQSSISGIIGQGIGTAFESANIALQQKQRQEQLNLSLANKDKLYKLNLDTIRNTPNKMYGLSGILQLLATESYFIGGVKQVWRDSTLQNYLDTYGYNINAMYTDVELANQGYIITEPTTANVTQDVMEIAKSQSSFFFSTDATTSDGTVFATQLREVNMLLNNKVNKGPRITKVTLKQTKALPVGYSFTTTISTDSKELDIQMVVDTSVKTFTPFTLSSDLVVDYFCDDNKTHTVLYPNFFSNVLINKPEDYLQIRSSIQGTYTDANDPMVTVVVPNTFTTKLSLNFFIFNYMKGITGSISFPPTNWSLVSTTFVAPSTILCEVNTGDPATPTTSMIFYGIAYATHDSTNTTIEIDASYSFPCTFNVTDYYIQDQFRNTTGGLIYFPKGITPTTPHLQMSYNKTVKEVNATLIDNTNLTVN